MNIFIKLTAVALFSVTAACLFPSQSFAAEKSASSKSQLATLTVNLNKATAEELADVLIGVGLNKAKTIVEYRNSIGTFTSVEQLLKVKGIGVATLEKNRHKIKLR